MGKVVEIKTQQTTASVADYINTVTNEQQRKDSTVILDLMKKYSGEEPKMWGASLIGFGIKRYQTLFLTSTNKPTYWRS